MTGLKVQMLVPAFTRPRGASANQFIPEGAQIELDAPHQFSWRAMRPIGWDPEKTEGVPPRPEPQRKLTRDERFAKAIATATASEMVKALVAAGVIQPVRPVAAKKPKGEAA